MHIAEITSHVESETKKDTHPRRVGGHMEENDHLIIRKYPFMDNRRRLAVKVRGVLWAVQHAVIASTLSRERVSLITKRGGLQKKTRTRANHGRNDCTV